MARATIIGWEETPSHRDQLRSLIDDVLTQKPADLDALLKLLQEAGVVVKRRRKKKPTPITAKHEIG